MPSSLSYFAFLTSPLLWLTIALILVIRSILELYVTWKRLPPGPMPWPVVGNFLLFNVNKGNHEVMLELSRKFGDMMTIFYARHPAIILNKYDLAKSILQQPTFSCRPESAVVTLICKGYQDIAFAKYNPLLMFHRKVFTKCIKSASESERLERIVNDMVDLTVRDMWKQPEKVDPKLHMCHITYNVFYELAYEKHYQIDDPEFIYLKDSNDVGLQELVEASIFDFLPFADRLPLMWIPTVRRSVQHEWAMGDLRMKQILEQRKIFVRGQTKGFVDALLEEQASLQEEGPAEADKLHNQYLAWIMMHFFSDAVDPMSRTMRWVVLYLIMYPDLQEECYEEIKRAIDDRPPRLEDRSSLPLVEAFILECMRKRPVGPLGVPHAPTHDAKIGEYTIPEGTVIMANIYAMHHDPEHWTNPDQFDPRQHFIDENGRLKMHTSYAPFGFGRRICLGEQVSRNVLFLAMVRLLQQVRLEPIEGEKYTDDYDLGETLNVITLPFTIKVSSRK